MHTQTVASEGDAESDAVAAEALEAVMNWPATSTEIASSILLTIRSAVDGRNYACEEPRRSIAEAVVRQLGDPHQPILDHRSLLV